MTDTAPSYPIYGLASPANLLTIGRIAVSPLLFWLILDADATRGTSWMAFVVGWVLGVSDFFDGKVARWTGQVSRSGAFLDPLADKVVVLGAAFCLVSVDRIALLPVVIITLREAAVSALRLNFARQGLAMPARTSAKYKTFVQGLALVFAVFPPLEDHQTVIDVGVWIAVILTVFTGIQYVLDGRSATSTTGA